jgi:hypothetical protein
MLGVRTLVKAVYNGAKSVYLFLGLAWVTEIVRLL